MQSPTCLSELPDGPVTVRRVVELFLANATRGNCDDVTASRRRIFKAFLSAYGERLVETCKPFDLVAFVNSNQQWRSDWTIRSVVAMVQRPFNWAARMGLIARNPFGGISHPSGESGRPMTDEEFRSLLRSTDARFRRVLMFLRLTGCRPGELAALRWENVAIAQASIVLRKHKTVRATKDRKPRVIVLVPPVVALLGFMMREQTYTINPNSPVFQNANGGAWTRFSLAARIKRLKKRLGLPEDCRLYALRHRFGTQAVMNGLDTKTLAQLMGHTSTRMTEHYIHLSGQADHLREAAAQAVRKKKLG